MGREPVGVRSNFHGSYIPSVAIRWGYYIQYIDIHPVFINGKVFGMDCNALGIVGCIHCVAIEKQARGKYSPRGTYSFPGKDGLLRLMEHLIFTPARMHMLTHTQCSESSDTQRQTPLPRHTDKQRSMHRHRHTTHKGTQGRRDAETLSQNHAGKQIYGRRQCCIRPVLAYYVGSALEPQGPYYFQSVRFSTWSLIVAFGSTRRAGTAAVQQSVCYF